MEKDKRQRYTRKDSSHDRSIYELCCWDNRGRIEDRETSSRELQGSFSLSGHSSLQVKRRTHRVSLMRKNTIRPRLEERGLNSKKKRNLKLCSKGLGKEYF